MPRAKVSLPEVEVLHLATLSGQALRNRARELFTAGWSLSAIGEALTPPRSRSTIQSWVTPPSTSASSSSSPITAAENSDSHSVPVPAPADFTSARRDRRSDRAAPFDPARPNLDPVLRAQIASVAPFARRYRARSNSTGEYARANEWLTRTCKEQYSSGVSIRELSDAAGVTYKAMEKRVKR